MAWRRVQETKSEPGAKRRKEASGIHAGVNAEGLVVLRPSNKRLCTLLSSLETSVYDVTANEWRIDAADYVRMRKELRREFGFEDIPGGVLRTTQRSVEEQSFELVGPVFDALLPFQREGVVYALNRGGRVLLADDMGLGKTVQALATAYFYRAEWPLLIVAPASLLDTWKEACRRFLDMDAEVTRGGETDAAICIMSYEIASSNASALKMRVVIADECHYLKSQGTKRTRQLVPLLQRASRVLLLSGTPAVSRPLELYPIISAVDKELFPRFTEYGMRYCNGRKIGQWYDYKGCTNAEELHFVLRKSLMVRRTKDQVLSQLPPKSRRQVVLQAASRQSVLGGELVGDVETSITTQYKEAVALKIEAVKQYLSTVVEKDVKFIVFCHHVEMMEGLAGFFREKSVPTVRIDGSTPSGSRNALVREYQENEEIRVALLSITACCAGLTLTAGRAVVFAELYWNPGTLLQAEDRVHRIGQKRSVDIMYLVAKGTIDEYVWPTLLAKLNVLESLGIGSNELKNVHAGAQRTLHHFNIK